MRRALLLLAAAALAAGQNVPCADNVAPLGHFISASVSWKQMEGRTVEFEIVSTWRRNFQWPLVLSEIADPASWSPRLGDIIPIVGLSNIPDNLNDCTKQLNEKQSTDGNETVTEYLLAKQPAASGQDVFTKFDPGDGSIKTDDLKLQVVSYSEEENWIMGITRITHTYPRDYDRLEERWDDTSYVASALNKESTQPYNVIPWHASFSGCCRQYTKKIASTNMLTYHFESTAMVDLSNNVGSAKIITMPQVFVPAQSDSGTLIRVCALPVAGMDSMMDKTGGTINVPGDDMMQSQFSWSLKDQGEPGDEIIEQPLVADALGQDMAERESRRSKMCAAIRVASRLENSKDYITIECKLGTATVTADVELHVLDTDSQIIRTTDPQSKCLSTGDGVTMCRYMVPIGSPLTNQEAIRNLFRGFQASGSAAGTPLYLKYVVGTVGIPSACGTNACQTTLLGTSEAGRIEYSSTEIGMDHSGLPSSASFNPVSSQGLYVTSIEVDFRASDHNTRPGHDVTISAPQRQYSQTIENMHQVETMCTDTMANFVNEPYCKVPDSNFNMGAGGADVGIWLRRDSGAMAITDVAVATADQVAGMMANGFMKIDHNLLEQSGRGEIFLMIKRGSGPPLLHIRAQPMSGYSMISTTLNGVTVSLYVLYSTDAALSRDLNWTPCTGETSPMVVCGAAAMRQNPSYWTRSVDPITAKLTSSPQICTLVDPHPVRPPTIGVCAYAGATAPITGPNGEQMWEVPMGKELRICVLADRIDRAPETETFSISFAEVSGNPVDMPHVDGLLTGRTPTGAKLTNLNGVEGQFTPISEVCATSDGQGQCSGMGGFMSWTPSPYQGGWDSEVCLRACVDAGPCPESSMSPSQSCVVSCFRVHVPRCRWWLQPEDSFIEIAPRFQTNWLQLWYLNPGIRHPDYDLTAEQNEVTIGRLYKPRWDDTMKGIAERFAISEQRLLDLNVDLVGLTDDQLVDPAADRQICIIPDSCAVEEPSNTGRND